VGNDFIAVSAGGRHSLSLKIDGTIIGWGDNSDGQATPPDGNDFIAVSAGAWHSLALKADGTIVGWGSNYSKDDGEPGPRLWYGQATPPDGNDFIAISASPYSSLALKADGTIVGWSDNRSGQATPPRGDDFIAISAGGGHSLALQRVCRYVLHGDLNDDCEVDLDDFALMAENWLIDCHTAPLNPACVPK